MKILAIDTSCDDTSAAVLDNDAVLSNVISSQVQFHTEWGGVVPSLAKRLHQEKIDTVIEKSLTLAGTRVHEIDLLAVTHGPGLAIALEVGIKKAIEIAERAEKPLMCINHMEGHLYSVFAKNSKKKGQFTTLHFPYLALLASGAHTELVLMENHGEYRKIGEKLDDAVGEAFDKAARMLGFGYPGGAIMAKLAKKGEEKGYTLPVPMKHSKDLNFSYSGLKTATFQLISSIKKERDLTAQDMYDISKVFQEAALGELYIKVQKALEIYTVHGIIIGGGVSANTCLRKNMRELATRYTLPVYFPLQKKLCSDNAAMIGVCAYWRYVSGKGTIYHHDFSGIDRDPVLSL